MAAREAVVYMLELGGNVDQKSREAAAGITDMSSAAKAGLNAAGALSAGLIALGGAYQALANDIYGTVDSLNTLAQGTGLAQDTVSGLRLAAKAANKDLKDLVPTELSKRMLDAANGLEKAQRGFRQLGVEVVDAAGNLRSTDAVYRDLVTALLEVEDPTLRAALATQALGEQGKQALSAFSDTGDLERFVALANEFGINAGPAALEASNNWWAATAQLSLAWENAKTQLLGGSSAIAELVKAFSVGAVAITEFVVSISDELADLGSLWWNLTTSDIPGAWDALQRLADSDGLTGALDDAYERSQRFWELQRTGAEDAQVAILDLTNSLVAFTRLQGWEPDFDGLTGDPSKGPTGQPVGGFKPPARAKAEQQSTTSADLAALRDGVKIHAASQRFLWELSERSDAAFAETMTQASAEIGDMIARSDAMTGSGSSGLEFMQIGQFAGQIGQVLSSAVGGPIVTALQAIADVPDMLDGVLTQVDTLIDDLVAIPDKLVALADRIPDVVANVATVGPQLIRELVENLPDLLTIELIPQIVGAVIKSMVDVYSDLFSPQFWIDAGKAMGEAIWEVIKGVLNPFKGKDGNFLGTNLTAEGDKKLFGVKLPEFATGTDYVKRDGLAYIHQGEAILPAPMAQQWRQGGGGGNSTSIGGITIVGGNPRELAPQLQRMLGLYGANLDLSALV